MIKIFSFKKKSIERFMVYSHAAIGLLSYSYVSIAADLDVTKFSVGGYLKIDLRNVNGQVSYQDYWIANNPGVNEEQASRTGFNVRESRLNIGYKNNDIKAFVEFDFYGGGGNEVVSNSSTPRLRHAKIDYGNWTIGQTWSTFMSLAAFPESLDFGGPHVGEAFIRQALVRYTKGGLQLAIENPETNGDGDIGAPVSGVGLTGSQADPDEDIPDIVGSYTVRKDWGEIKIAALVRKLDQGNLDKDALAGNFSGRINIYEKDDFRFQVNVGEPGRYVSAGLTPDVVINPENGKLVVEKTTAYSLAFRHFWTEKNRSSIYYGNTETKVLGRDRTHWAFNFISDVRKNLAVGVEFGNYSINDRGIEAADSDYVQFSAKFSL